MAHWKHGAPRALLLAVALANLPAMAAISDTVHPYVGLSYNYDDNLFRLPDALPGDNSQRSDTSRQVVVGVQFDRPIGRQRLVADAKVSKVAFSHFTQLDYDGKDLDGTWYWQVGNHLSGTAGATFAQTLTPFNDFHSTERNLRTQSSEFADANWLLHPSWRLHGRMQHTKFDYDLHSQQFLNRHEDTSEFGFDYLATSGSTMGLVARHTKGVYPNQLAFGPLVVNDSYNQDELKLKVLWLATPLTQVELLGGRARRTHTSSSLRDASGTNGRLTASWTPTPLLRVNLAGWREFTPFEGAGAAYSLSKGSSAGLSWSPLDRVRVEGKLEYVKRDFSSALFAGVLGFQDTTRNATLGVTYAPLTNVSLTASLLHDARSVDSRFGSAYRGNGASLSANLQF